jgi:hypothetical protein
MSRFIAAAVVALFAVVYAGAETYTGTFVAVKDGKITIRVLGKGDPESLQRTYPLADKVEVRHGTLTRDKATKKLTVEDGDLIEDGFKSDIFARENVEKRFRVAVVLDTESGKVTRVIVLPKPNKQELPE